MSASQENKSSVTSTSYVLCLSDNKETAIKLRQVSDGNLYTDNSENEYIEFKAFKHFRYAYHKDEIMKAICGFMNSKGGVIYLGIEDNGRVIGFDMRNNENKKGIGDFTSAIAKLMIEYQIPPANVHFATIPLFKKGYCVLAFSVEPSLKPVCYSGKYYLRVLGHIHAVDEIAVQNNKKEVMRLFIENRFRTINALVDENVPLLNRPHSAH